LMAQHLLEIAKAKGLPLQVPQVGSMFALFFSDQRVQNYADATASHTEHFAKLFKQCLELGVYLPPSAYETCFISTAHQGQDIEQAAELIGQALRQL